MRPWRALARGIATLRNRRAADEDIADEVAHYLEQLTREGVARGLTEPDARRAARVELGGEAQVREQVRSFGWENIIGSCLEDLRYAGRRLTGSPGFTAVAVVTLALGIGGTMAIFSAVNPILFRTLPYPDAERVRQIVETWRDGSRADATFGMYRGFADNAGSFDAFSVYRAWQPTITGGDRPDRLEGQRVSAQYFRVLGVAPVHGRAFADADDRAGSPKVVIISYPFWRQRLGGGADAIGRYLTLDGDSYAIIGVMPAGFENVLSPAADLWTTLKYDLSEGRAWGHHLGMVARLRPGVDAAEAVAELNGIGARVVREQRPPTYEAGVEWTVPSLQSEITRGVRPALLAVLGAVVLLLLLACVNVTNLLLARGANRRAEFALRAALGAPRTRLIRQLLTESLLLAVVGGVVGVVVATAGVRALVALSPADLPRLDAIALDPATLAFGFAITVLTGVAFGLVPAIRSAGHEHGDLHQGVRRVISGRGRVRSALVVMQLALALVLLTGSGLLLRSMQRLFAVSPGFDASGLLTMQIHTSGHRFADDSATFRFFAEALDAVQQQPAVTSAALTSQLPLSGDHDAYGVHFVSSPTQEPHEDRSAFRYAVSPNYIAVMGIPLRAGRTFGPDDRAGAPLVALISESLARRRFPGEDPVGQRLRIGPPDGPPYTVIGVVGDVKQMSLAGGAPDAVYTTASQWRFADNVMSLVIRARDDPAALAPSVRGAVWSVDSDQPVVRVAVMTDLLAASAAQRRFSLILFQAFALTALLLAAAGTYGMLAGSVGDRTREIGLRSAVGATRAGIIRMVLSHGLKLVIFGIALGLTGAAAASRVIEVMLYDVSPLDPATYAGVVAVLTTVALLACAVPAWRAARIDPAITLRND